MDDNNVKKVAQSGADILNKLAGKVTEGNQTILDICKKELDGKDNVILTVKNQKVLSEAPKAMPKAESPRREHVLHDATGFGEYLTKYKSEDTVVLVDIANQEASAIIDEKAGKGFEIISMKPVLHPLYVPWDGLFKKGEINIQAFARFLRENRRQIVSPDGMELVTMLNQIKVSRNITLHRGTGAHSVNGILCEMDIAGANKEKKELALPDTMMVSMPMYLSTVPVDLEIDINIDADDKNIFVTCTCPDVMPRRIDAFNGMLTEIKAIEDVTVALGTPKYSQWERLSENGRSY